jgi:hypothetical protein
MISMKLLLLILGLVIFMEDHLSARIINAYDKDIASARLSIQQIRQLLDENPQFNNRHKKVLKARIKELSDLLVYHQVTDTLLAKFKTIAPNLYAAIDTLKDHQGRIVDVFVKFEPVKKSGEESLGLAILGITPDGREICVSPYGHNSVTVLIKFSTNSLAVLSHEFGHIQYMVPNLTKYVHYYRGAYQKAIAHNHLGHACNDVGGRNALRFENSFRSQYYRYVRSTTGDRVIPFAFISIARKRLSRQVQSEWEIVGVQDHEGR